MTKEIDLRDRPEEKYHEELFNEVGKVDTNETLGVVSDRDIDPLLIRYQIENDRILEWEHAHPDAEPRKLQVTVGGPLGDDSLAVIDVRDLKPQRRHEVLLEIFNELQADEGFTLLNDHDPKPLYHELKSMHGDVVDWEYESRQSGEWRVEIVKTDNSEADDEDIVTRYDVRKIPKQERHPTIHHRYGMIPEGGTLELVAAHEPRPLHQEFRHQYGDSFTWDVIEIEPGRCRVQVTKCNSVDEANETSDSEATVTASPTDEEGLEIVTELDVRDRPPAERHAQIFDAYDELDTGTGFVLVNDHDPKPLYHQFEAEEGPEFHWTYRKRDAGEFKVLIGKTETTVDGQSSEETAPPF